MNNNLRTSRGDLSAYALSLGYKQESMDGRVQLERPAACTWYLVKVYDLDTMYPIKVTHHDTVADARRAFRQAVR